MSESERILVVDDEQAMLWMVRRVLEPFFEIETATGTEEALALSARKTFQIALVDVQLEDSHGDGYFLCQQLRARDPELDVILMTGSVSQPGEKLFRSLEKDAFYFLFKPFERRVLRALVERCLRLQRERKAKERYAARLAADLEKARDFQHSLLPKEALSGSGWHMDGRFIPCDALGGDLYLYRLEREPGASFAISDVVGHGVSAAMYAGMLQTTLEAARRHSPKPESVLVDLLKGIDFFENSRYASMIYGTLNPSGLVRYFNAGHPHLYWQTTDNRLTRLPSTGIILTRVFPDHPREVRQVELARGDRLLAYTDGANEALDPHDNELGFEGLEQALKATRHLPVGQALDAILDTVGAHCGGRPRDDDLTLLMLEYTG